MAMATPACLSDDGLENPNGAALRIFVEGAEMAPALAEPDAAYAR